MNLQKVIVVLLAILAAIGIGFVLDFAQPVVLPLVIAFLISITLEPVVKYLTKLQIPRSIAIIIVILMLLGVVGLIGFFFFTSIQSFIREYPQYIEKLNNIINIVSNRYLSRLNIPEDPLLTIDWVSPLRNYLMSLSGDVTRFVGIAVIILFVLVFLFMETPQFKTKLGQAFPLHTSRRIGIILEHITRQVARYLGVKAFISFMTGAAVWFCLTLIGLDFPLLWGGIAFFLNFIPNLGSTIVVIVISVMGFVQFFPSAGKILAVVITMTGIQLALGNFLDPKMQGQRLNLSPVIILASLIFWGWLWGVVGALISVPIAATIKIVCENIPALRPVGVLMGTGKKRRRRGRGIF